MCILDWLDRLLTPRERELPSPQDWVPAENLTAYAVAREHSAIAFPLTPLKVALTHPPLVWMPAVTDSGSMDPVVDFGHHNIFIAGADAEDHRRLVDALQVGDIVVYRFPAEITKQATAFINHRIVNITEDPPDKSKFGRIFRCRGDNNAAIDPFIVRDPNIKWISIGMVY